MKIQFAEDGDRSKHWERITVLEHFLLFSRESIYEEATLYFFHKRKETTPGSTTLQYSATWGMEQCPHV